MEVARELGIHPEMLYRRAREVRLAPQQAFKGGCYDNAPMESFFSTLKRERVNRRKYWSRDEAVTDTRD